MSNRKQVAIVGLGCRLPGGIESPGQLASFLRGHGDAVIEVPEDRWSVDLYYDPDPRTPGKTHVRRGAFLRQDVFSFDPDPFGISAKEADQLDPQQRLLLEVTWEAFEDAGIPADGLRGSNTSVFIGGFTLDHQGIAFLPSNRRLISSHTSVGASMTLLSNRLSYTFDLRGASMTVDTACSSSLVATHLGYESIIRGECDLAVVGGVNVMLSPATMIAMSKGQFLAADGRSKTFDANADGYGRGEGAAVAILKPLARALDEGDRIYAVIVATGMNQDGRTPGIAMPSEDAQRALCERVLRSSRLRPRDIGYVEAHGTGTRAGDPIEVRALGSVYGRRRASPVLIGSLKSNIGHLEAAAGIAGLAKAALSIHGREIFPLRALDSPNPGIPFDDLNLQVALRSQPWPDKGPASAAVNSFGYGGTNAHVILSEAPARGKGSARRRTDAPGNDGAMHVVPLSAASRSALVALADRLSEAVDDDDWPNQAYTLAVRRSHLPERAALLATSAEDLRHQLRGVASEPSGTGPIVGRASAVRRLLWVFTGMGPQWWAMGQELYRSEPVFRIAAEEADEAFESVAGWSVLSHMLRDESSSQMSSNLVAQPANFVLQVALVALLRSLGVPDHGLLGHSVGEVAAAWAAGCLSLGDAAFVAYHRSRLQQTVAGHGTMLAVTVSESELPRFLIPGDDVTVAAYNAPRSLALAGARGALDGVAARMTAEGIFNRFVPVEVAYHSPHMDPLEGELRSALAAIAPRAPLIDLYSTARGRRVAGAEHDAAYWWENARRPVRLQDAVQAALADGYTACLEIGPHPVLATAIRELMAQNGREPRTFFCMKRGQPEKLGLFRLVGELYVGGVALRWDQLYPSGRLAELPKYPFQRERHWTESEKSRDLRVGRSAGPFTDGEDGPKLSVVSDLARPSLSYLLGHRVQGAVVFPGAAYVDSALSACVELDDSHPEYLLEDLVFERPLVIRRGAAPVLRVEIDRDDGALTIDARHEDDAWERHARARAVESAHREPLVGLDLGRLQAECGEALDIDEAYRRFDQIGLAYEAEFRALASLRVRRDGVDGSSFVARLRADLPASGRGCVHPALLDGAFQAALATLEGVSGAMVPVSAARVRWVKGAGAVAWAYGSVRPTEDGAVRADVGLFDEEGKPILEVRNLVCRALDRSRASDTVGDGLFHLDSWRAGPWPTSSTVDARAHAQTDTWGLAGSATRWLDRLDDELHKHGALTLRADLDHAASASSCSRWVFAIEPTDADPVGLEACERLRQLVVLLAGASCSLRVVTFGAQSAAGRDVPNPSQAALWGFARVAMTEHPEIDCRLIDLPATSLDMPAGLIALLEDAHGDEELAVREDALYAHRITRATPSEMVAAPLAVPLRDYDGAYALEAGVADTPRLASRPRFAPSSDEVEVAVLYASVDTADYSERRSGLKASLQPRLRSFVGTVSRVGGRIARVRVGDTVHMLGTSEVRSHVVAQEARVVPLLVGHSPAAAVAYIDFFLAWHALIDVARLDPTERILIHDAASPLGSACMQVARMVGAEILVTASTDADTTWLRTNGAHRVYASQTVDFVDAIRADTEGAGVDVVINAPPSIARDKSLELLGATGRLIDLSAIHAQRVARIKLESLLPSRTFSVVDLGAFGDEHPAEYLKLTSSVFLAFADGRLRLPPPREFDARDLVAMSRALSEPGQTGRVVLDFGTKDAVVDMTTGQDLFRPDRTYLVSGGLGGFGLATAEWLVEQGARSIVLAGRRGRPTEETSVALQRMRRLGARVECMRLDVADGASIDALLDFVGRELLPLAGVFHSAMVLDDRSIRTLDRDSLAAVMLPKAQGAWLLHQKTRDLRLDYFVMYSSVSALVGNPHQASYAAANAFLDALAQARRCEGLAATTVSWGAIDDVGVVARSQGTKAHLGRLGIQALPLSSALVALGRTLRSGRSNVGIIDIRWDHWRMAFPSARWHRLDELSEPSEGASDNEPLAQLRSEIATWGKTEKRERVVSLIRVAAAQALGVQFDRLDSDIPLTNYGLDSLLAVELQVALERVVGVTIPTIQFVAGICIAEIADRALEAIDAPTLALGDPAAPVRPTQNLRDHFLSRICVQPPYFALFDFTRDGDWVEATVNPVPPGDCENDVVSCAEAARHLAIVGSCAASLRCPLPGRVYYPVRRAVYMDARDDTTEGTTPMGIDILDTARVRARCIDFDLRASRATAETILLDLHGNVIFSLMVEYHVIPGEDFGRLFAERRQITNEDSGLDPYAYWSEVTHREEGEDVLVADLGVVDPAQCVGHFVGYPALPVSIMTRHAINLVATGMRRRAGPAACITVVSGWAETKSFLFADQRATMRARCLQTGGARGRHVWRCEVVLEAEVIAVFELTVEVRALHVSELRAVRRVGLTG